MTLSDFNVPLKTKLFGTRNLSQTFESSALDFYILLSSATAVVGTRGQANYAAGNTFQDAFAQLKSSPKAHYISVSPGMIEGADANDPIRERNLRVHGLLPVPVDTLMASMEYAMSPKAKQDNCKNAIIGFDSESISQVGIRNANVHSAMFSHLLDDVGMAKSQEPNANNLSSFEKAVGQANDLKDVRSIVVRFAAGKLAELVSSKNADAMIEKPFVEIGLDSLSYLDLRDWIMDAFRASVQLSEVMIADDVMDLAETIVERSKTVGQRQWDDGGNDSSG